MKVLASNIVCLILGVGEVPVREVGVGLSEQEVWECPDRFKSVEVVGEVPVPGVREVCIDTGTIDATRRIRIGEKLNELVRVRSCLQPLQITLRGFTL
jgi:hypothetical protein